MTKVYLGIDIGGSNTKYGIFKLDGDLLISNSIKTNSDQEFKTFLKNLHINIKQSLSSLKEKFSIQSIGVGAPNANPLTGELINPPNLEWGIVDLVVEFESEFLVKTILENDANISAIGEKYFGHGKEYSNFIVITLGTGVGVGTFIDNKLFTGKHGIGSEAGHINIHPKGRPCSCGGAGHLEAYASKAGILETAAEKFERAIDFKELSELFKNDNKTAISVVENLSFDLALGLSSMSSILCPEAFIISGGVSNLGDKFINILKSDYEKLVYESFRGKTIIQKTDISAKQGAIYGAVALVLND